jgi:hypothetical protein
MAWYLVKLRDKFAFNFSLLCIRLVRIGAPSMRYVLMLGRCTKYFVSIVSWYHVKCSLWVRTNRELMGLSWESAFSAVQEFETQGQRGSCHSVGLSIPFLRRHWLVKNDLVLDSGTVCYFLSIWHDEINSFSDWEMRTEFNRKFQRDDTTWET